MKKFYLILFALLAVVGKTNAAETPVSGAIQAGVEYTIAETGNSVDDYFTTSEVIESGKTVVVFYFNHSTSDIWGSSPIYFGPNGVNPLSRDKTLKDAAGNSVCKLVANNAKLLDGSNHAVIEVYHPQEEGATWTYVICTEAEATSLAIPEFGNSSGSTTKPGQDEANAVVITTAATPFSAVEVESQNVFYAKFTASNNGVATINMTKADATVAQYKAQGAETWSTIPADGKLNITKSTTYYLRWVYASVGDGNISYSAEYEKNGDSFENAIVLTEGVAVQYSSNLAGSSHQEYFTLTPDKDGEIEITIVAKNSNNEDQYLISQYWYEEGVMNYYGTALQANSYPSKPFNVVAGHKYYFYTRAYAAHSGTCSFNLKDTGTMAEYFMDETENRTELPAVGTIIENLTSNRILSSEKWNTLCLPFDVPASDFAEVIEVYDVENPAGNLYTVKFAAPNTTTLEAGKPYLVKAKAEMNGESLAYSNVEIKVNEPVIATKGYGKIIGTFLPTNVEGNYFISDNLFYYADISVYMKGYRFYINLPAEANVRSFAIEDNIIETAVEEMQATGAKTATVTFDLSGKKVAVKKGIVIENGQKVMY